MSDELKRCPFCGCAGPMDLDYKGSWFMGCTGCGARGPRAVGGSVPAATAWNERAAATVPQILAAAFHASTPIVIRGAGAALLVTINPDGTVTYGECYTPDEAARAFWEGLAAANPLRGEVERLTADVERITAANERLRATIRLPTKCGTRGAVLFCHLSAEAFCVAEHRCSHGETATTD